MVTSLRILIFHEMAQMITILLEPVSGSRSEKQGLAWRASCRYGGSALARISRSGATYSICRELARLGAGSEAAGVRGADGRLILAIALVADAAKVTVAESARHPIRLVDYKEFSDTRVASGR